MRRRKYRPQNADQLKELVSSATLCLGDIDTSAVTDMSGLFFKPGTFSCFRDNFDGIETWDTSNVMNISGMFLDATEFDQPIGIRNTSRIAKMSGMFS